MESILGNRTLNSDFFLLRVYFRVVGLIVLRVDLIAVLYSDFNNSTQVQNEYCYHFYS